MYLRWVAFVDIYYGTGILDLAVNVKVGQIFLAGLNDPHFA